MTFDDWWKKDSGKGSEKSTHCHLAKQSWNAAIDMASIAIESSHHNDDYSGLSANCNAMIAVERLKAS